MRQRAPGPAAGGTAHLGEAPVTFQSFLYLVCVACLVVITLAVMQIAWGVIG